MLGFTRSASPPRAAALPTLAAAPALSLDLPEISSAEQYEAISIPASDLVANGRVSKFLIDLRRPDAPGVHFVNANYEEGGEVPEAARYHYFFAREALGIPEGLEEFNQVTYFTEDKRYVAGVVHTYQLAEGEPPVWGLQFYPQDVIRERGVLDAVRLVRAKITVPAARFAFVATGSQQTTGTVEGEISEAGIEILPIDRILGAIKYLPLNQGEAWGYLRIFPEDNDDLAPTDIPVFDELPLDLSVVAGVITRAVQDTNSHVNLKSKERGTPNMVLRDAGTDNPRFTPFADRPVHFVVRGDDFLLEETTPEEVAAKLAERMSRPWIPLSWGPETRLLSYAEMAAGSPAETLAFSKRYGAKAANLGFLTHRRVLGRTVDAGSPSQRLGYDLVPGGFGVPLELYRTLVDYEPNGDLREKLRELIEAEKGGTLSGNERVRLVDEVQTAFLTAKFPLQDLSRIKAKLQEVLPGVKKIKVRSSANAEDIPNFDGAGLHDSFSATVSKKDNEKESCRIEIEDEEGDGGEVKRKVLPKSVACAVKGVYASLWNKRAIEERTFARIDHETVAMGIAIVAAYDNESDVAANAVVITRVINTKDVYGYSFSVQEGNNLVTNPDPGTYSEVTVAALGVSGEPTSLTVTRYAKPAPDRPERTTPVLSREQMLALVDLAATTEVAYCRAKPSYSEGRDCGFIPLDSEKPKSLDMEMKILEDGRFVCKQVREFGGR
jgi:hypothetical protein